MFLMKKAFIFENIFMVKVTLSINYIRNDIWNRYHIKIDTYINKSNLQFHVAKTSSETELKCMQSKFESK